MYYAREAAPATLAEAVVYATYWYADSGWHAFVNGWCFGNGMADTEVVEFKKPGRKSLIEWANVEIRR